MDIYDKSLRILKKIIDAQREYGFRIVLVGGWAIYSYNPYMKSRDIDLIVSKGDYWKLSNFLKSLGFSETHGEHPGKKGFLMLYQGDKIEIDVYDETVAGFNVETAIKNAVEKTINEKEVNVASITDLTIMKLKSSIDRLGSPKGEKDLSDLLAVFDKHYRDINWDRVAETIGKKDVTNVLRILFSDIKQTYRIYRLDFKRFQETRKFLQNKNFVPK